VQSFLILFEDDNNGFISKNEFVRHIPTGFVESAFMQLQSDLATQLGLEEHLDRVDTRHTIRDGSGFLSAEDLAECQSDLAAMELSDSDESSESDVPELKRFPSGKNLNKSTKAKSAMFTTFALGEHVEVTKLSFHQIGGGIIR